MRRVLKPIVDLRENEGGTAALMFAYSFLAMTAYNIVKPATRSTFISGLGADNLPWVQLGAGILIGFIMQAYSRVIGFVPRRWAIPVTQAACAGLLVLLWVPLAAKQEWASVVFYVLGLILGILLISQFWTLANDIYDARQAKRLFGFIGGGASLGGATGAALTSIFVRQVGTANMVLLSAFVMLVCVVLVIAIVRREHEAGKSAAVVEEEGVGGGEAIRLLRDSKHLQVIAIVIGCAAMGAAIVEQQLNMAAEAQLGAGQTDSITAFLAQVTVYLSLIGFAIQVGVTSRIHRLLGLGFALMILPVALGATAVLMLFNRALWAPALARILDTSLRYTVDKTSREVLFLPLPTAIKYKAKPFVDVTMDRFAKAMGALLILVLIKPWGLNLDWQRLSLASLTLMAIWVFMALRARREYLAAFRRSIEKLEVAPADIRLAQADLQAIETLVEELAHPDERRVLYAIDLLESLDKRNLITPLLLHHTSPAVRARTLQSLQALRRDLAHKWVPAIERLLTDEDDAVRAGAVRAISAIRGQEAAGLMRPYLDDANPRVACTAAVALASSAARDDVDAAYLLLQRLAQDSREGAAPARREAARALAHIADPRFGELLVPLMYDQNLDVARSAIRSAARHGANSFLFLPALISLLRNRLLKADARAVIVGYGDTAIESLSYFLRDQDEDIWVRRHLPATLALLPSPATVSALVAALADRDGFIRFKAVVALERIRRERPDLTIPREPIEAMVQAETLRYANALTLHANLVPYGGFARDHVLTRALAEKQLRSRNRIFLLLGLIYPYDDIAAARYAIDHGDTRGRASATEYLDNLLGGELRRRVMLLIEEMPADERIRRANVLFRTRRRDPEDTLAQLIHDEDQIVAAAAIQLVAERGAWKLADDVEHALAHRDVRDWYVFEAASWALAARRMAPSERRQRWLEPLPAVELAARLRQIPLFDYVSVDELFRVAGTGRQVRHEPGRIIYPEGVHPDTLQFLIDGEVAIETGEGNPPVQRPAPTALAFEEMLEGMPMRATVRASDVAIALTLTREEFLTLLSDNIELAHGLFKMLLDSRSRAAWGRAMRGRIPPDFARMPIPETGFQPIELVMLLQTSPLLERATGEQLLRLAAIARHTNLVEGAVLFGETENAAIYTLLSGEVRVEAPGEAPVTLDAGDTVGIYEALAGVPAGARVTVTKSGAALRIDRRELFDLLADNIDLLQGLFSGLLRSQAPAVPA